MRLNRARILSCSQTRNAPIKQLLGVGISEQQENIGNLKQKSPVWVIFVF